MCRTADRAAAAAWEAAPASHPQRRLPSAATAAAAVLTIELSASPEDPRSVADLRGEVPAPAAAPKPNTEPKPPYLPPLPPPPREQVSSSSHLGRAPSTLQSLIDDVLDSISIRPEAKAPRPRARAVRFPPDPLTDIFHRPRLTVAEVRTFHYSGEDYARFKAEYRDALLGRFRRKLEEDRKATGGKGTLAELIAQTEREQDWAEWHDGEEPPRHDDDKDERDVIDAIVRRIADAAAGAFRTADEYAGLAARPLTGSESVQWADTMYLF